jgi:hypothetical protein
MLKTIRFFILFITITFSYSCSNSFSNDKDAYNYTVGEWTGQTGINFYDKIIFNDNGRFERYSSSSNTNWGEPYSNGKWEIVSRKRKSDGKLIFLVLLNWNSDFGEEYSAWPFNGKELQSVYNREANRIDRIGPMYLKL